MDLLDRIVDVIDSCETLEQLEVATKYANLGLVVVDDWMSDDVVKLAIERKGREL